MQDAGERCSNGKATIYDERPPQTTVYPLVLRSEFDECHQKRDFDQSKDGIVDDRVRVVPLRSTVSIMDVRL